MARSLHGERGQQLWTKSLGGTARIQRSDLTDTLPTHIT